ncbi:hypothetical protein F4680DRAFT_445229 [Xylaria scruposa]|nr:hypothetical protein F4680DRAFT_445229 [Xylaria scruposa]
MGAYFGKPSKTPPEPSSLHSNINTRADLISCIKGSRVRIPDLQSLFTHWPQYVHPQVGELEEYVQRTLESIFPGPEEEERLRKMKATEVALFAASWWAYAPFEMLCVATTLSIWLFVWDDGQMSTFVKELALFINMCQEEHNFQMTANLPTIEEYLQRRMGSSAVRVAQSQADTLVPLLFQKLKSVQAAVDEAAVMIAKSIERLETAENEIMSYYCNAPEIQDMIRHHIEACKLACTANLNWR